MTKYESQIKDIPQPQAAVYARLSDLRGLEALRSRLEDPAVQSAMSARLGQDKALQAQQMMQQMEFTADSVTIASPVGQVRLVVVERDEPKLVKLEGENTPIPLCLWLQLVPHGEEACRLRVTLGAEVNIFMRSMVSKPLQQAADGLSDILCAAMRA